METPYVDQDRVKRRDGHGPSDAYSSESDIGDVRRLSDYMQVRYYQLGNKQQSE